MATRCLIILLVLALCCVHASGDPKYISLLSTGDGGNSLSSRRLLQVLTPCSVNFQIQNYSIITSECKGPQYPVNACCSAFVKFACPFAGDINDNTTDCANTMFNYINIYGRYPAGLFANECHGDENGLPCPATNTTTTDTSAYPELCVKHNQLLRWLVSILSTAVLFYLHCGGLAL